MSSAGICDWVSESEEEDEGWDVPLEEQGDDASELLLEVSRVNDILLASDGEGVHSQSTLDRAVKFLQFYYSEIVAIGRNGFPIPDIDLGPQGSIDIHWKRPTWELLVNIPDDDSLKAAYYGDRLGSSSIRGRFDVDEFNYEIAKCLMND